MFLFSRKVILINLLGLAIVLLLIETGVRMFAPSMPFEERAKASLRFQPSAYGKSWLDGSQEIFYQEGSRFFENKRNFRINRWGYRGEDFPLNKPKGEVRIVILGGSHIFDIAAFEHAGNPGFPAMLEHNLRREGFPVRVINAGVPGHSTLEMLSKMTLEIPRLSPDYIVFCSAWNDLKWIAPFSDTVQLIRTSPEAMQPNPLVFKVSVWDNLLGWSAGYRKARDAWWKIKLGLWKGGARENSAPVAGRSLNRQAGVSQYGNNYRLLFQLAQYIGAVPIFALEERLASLMNTSAEKKLIRYDYVGGIDHKTLLGLYRMCDSAGVSEAEKTGTRIVNFNKEMEGKAAYFKDHVHLSPIGSRYLTARYTDLFRNLLSRQAHGNP